MADYYPLLAKAVSGQAQSTPESRRLIYERARKALLGQLRNMNPPVPQADVDRESDALDEAIRKLEAELSPAAPPPAEVPSPPPVAPAAEMPRPEPPVVEPPPPTEPPVRPRIEPRRDGEAGAPPIPPPQRPARSLPPLPPIPPRVPTPRARVAAPIVTPPADAGAPVEEAAKVAPAKLEPELPLPVEPAAEVGGEEPQVRIEGIRPTAPQPRAPRGKGLRYGILILVLLVIVGGIAALAIKLKDHPEDILRARPQAAAEPTDTSGKIVERIGAGNAPTTPPPRPSTTQTTGGPSTPNTGGEPPQPAIPVAQRAALLIDAPDEPQKFKTFVGSVVWRIENVARGPGQPLAQAVRAEADIPDAGMKVSLLFQRNTDDAIPASHMLTVSFALTSGGVVPGVDEIDLPQMRNEVAPSVDSLFGVQAKITQNMFLIGLAKDATLTVRNVEMLRSRGWLDIPMRLTDGRIAKITLEKGPAGDRAIADAFASWGQ